MTAMPRTAAATMPGVSETPAAPMPIATIDSPRAMITMRPWRSAKCAGETRKPLPAADQAAQVVDSEGDHPERGLRAPVEEPGDDDDRGCQRGHRQNAQHDPQDVGVALAGDRKEQQLEQTHDQIRDPEQDGVCVEGFRDGERDDEHRSHRREHARAHRPLLGLERVRQPGIAGPRPPERREDEQPAADPVPRRVVRHEQRDLRDRVDEDEIEEELERGDPLLTLGHRWRLRNVAQAGAYENLSTASIANRPSPLLP